MNRPVTVTAGRHYGGHITVINTINLYTGSGTMVVTSLGQSGDTLLYNTTENFAGTDLVLLTTVDSREKFPDDPVSSAMAHLVLTVVQAGLLPVLTLSGVIMNVVNMAVFARQGLSDRINLCLFSLALSDTGYISVSMTSRLYSLFSLFDPSLGAFWKAQSLKLVGIYPGFLSTSNCLTLLISLERCVCVLWPLKAKTMLSTRHMAVVIVIIFLMCLCGCGLNSFRYNILSYRDPETNSLFYYNQYTRFYLQNQLMVDTITETIITLTLPTVCLVGVVMATLLITVRMRAVLSWRMKSAHVTSEPTDTSAERREHLVTRMLMVVCMLFTICVIPSVAMSFARLTVEGFEAGRRYTNVFYVTVCLVHLMLAVNSSGNFLIYWTMSTKFKATLRGLLQCHTKQAPPDSPQQLFSNGP